MASKGHAICVPFPAQGHITPMLHFAKLLHSFGLRITFVNTIYNHNRFLKSHGPHALDDRPNFRFESIPDGLPPPSKGAEEATQDIAKLCRSLNESCLGPLRDLIAKLNEEGPRVTCVVADGVLPYTLKAAEEFGVPPVLFWTMSGCGFLGYFFYHTLAEKGLIPLKDASYLTNGYLDTQVDLPGMKNVRLKDLPSFIRTTDPNEFMVKFMSNSVQSSFKASAIFLNTFESLEREVFDFLQTVQDYPPVYSVGPLNLLVDQIVTKDNDPISSINSSLWKEELGCKEWLDAKEPESVVYVNFGSITTMTQKQLKEFAWGLANSKKHFLWVIRPDIVVDENSPVLPEEFVVDTKERGMLASWCTQKEVLKHRAIGGFLTHSGWNSTLEAICGGVPVISWPFFAEQQTNCRYSCVEWGIGMEIENEVKRDEVEKLVRELIDGEKGKEMRRRAMEWKNKAEVASRLGGSSYDNLVKLIDQVSA